MLTVTQAGMAASTQADQNGFKISITDFKVSEHDVSGFTNSNFITATDLFGTAVHSGQVSLVEKIGTSTIKVTLDVPKELPRTGSWMLRELGLYLDTGELFAIGALDPAYEKNDSYGIRIYVTVTANRLGDTISVTVGQNNSLPAVAQIRELPAPIDSDQNVIAVLDEITNQYGSASAGLAVKSGPGLLHWAFAGHNRVYHGLTNSIASQSVFTVYPATGGFWLNNNEMVIAQITAGSGAGQSRRMKYAKTDSTFTVLDKAFELLDATSTVAIWRDNANQLPERRSDIGDYMVLGHGLNSWTKVPSAPTEYLTWEASSVSSILNNDSQLGSTIFEPPSSTVIPFVWCDGVLIPEGQYVLSWNIITVYGKPYGTKIDVLMLKQKTTTGAGGILNAFESKLSGDGQTTRFYFSIVPESQSWIAVYIDGVYQHQTAYDYEATSLVMHTAPAAGSTVLIVQLGLYDDTSGSCNTYRTFRQLVPGDTEISLSDTLHSKAQVLVFVDGKQYTQDDYILLASGLKIMTPPTFPGGSSYIDIYVFMPQFYLTDTPTSVSGTNSGPQWIDPAGLEGPPNKLVPKTVSILSDGAQTQISVPVVPDSTHVLVFVGNEYLQKELYSYSNGLVVLNTPAPSGTMVDVVCFTEVTIDGGFSVECTSFNLITSTDTFYQLAPVSDVDSIIVTMNGMYQHKLTYTVDAQSRIFFQGVQNGSSLEVWYFNVVPHDGYRVTLRYDKSGAAVANSYPLSQKVDRKTNVLTFVGNAKYDNSQYNINAAGDKVSLSPNVTSGTPIINVSFTSGAPKTRLLTREEYNRSVVSFNYRTGAILLTREDVVAVLQREDIFALLTDAEKAILAGQGGGNTGGGNTAEPGNTFADSLWTVPAGVYHIRAVIVGAGGGGGGGSNDLSYAGHGGKRGEVIIQEFDVVPGQQLVVRLGVGGSPYLYTESGTTVYPQPGDFGTTDGSRGYNGRNGGDTIFHAWVALGGAGGISEPAYAPTYAHADAAGEGQVAMSVGTGALSGGGLAGVTGVQTPGNNEMVYSYPGTNGAYGWSVPGSTGGGHNATVPGAGGGGAAADPNGVGAFGGAGTNGAVFISW